MLIVANYHYIREDFTAKYPSIFGVTPKQFKKQLQALSKTGKFISQEKLLKMTDFIIKNIFTPTKHSFV